jgi:hypothetical protein
METEKGETGEDQSQEDAHHFFGTKGIADKESILAGQTVNTALYRDALRRMYENVQRLCPELWRQKNWLLLHNNALSHTSCFTWKFFTINNVSVSPPTLISLKIKLKGRHVNTIEVIKAELQAVLNTIREHDFQDAFKKRYKHWK